MHINREKQITQDFIRDGETISPFLAIDWIFSIDNNRVIISSQSNNKSFYLSTLENFTKNYSFNPYFTIERDKLIGSYFFTSFGLVNEEDYYFALDVIENRERIPTKDLELNSIYISDKYKKYIYTNVKKLYIYQETAKSNILKKIIKDSNVLIDLESRKILKPASIRIERISNEDEFNHNMNLYNIDLEELRVSDSEIIIFSEVVFGFKYINNRSINYVREFCKINNIESDKIDNFIKNEELSLTISKNFETENEDLKLIKDTSIKIFNVLESLNLFKSSEFFYGRFKIIKTLQYILEDILSSSMMRELDFEKIFKDIYDFSPEIFDNNRYLFMSPFGLKALFSLLAVKGSGNNIIYLISDFDWSNSAYHFFTGERKYKALERDLFKYIEERTQFR